MKKILWLSCAISLALAGTGGALAYDIDDTTLVQPWSGGQATGGLWTDVIGDADTFDTFGADINGKIMTIYTNWNPGKDASGIKTADLFIDNDRDGSWDYAIGLDSLTSSANVYANPTYHTSDDLFKSTAGLVYGGRYNEGAPAPVPVQATNTSSSSTTSVVWTYGTNNLNNQVNINLDGLILSPFDFLWATGTCGGDVVSNVSAPVPEPTTMLLLGSGLLVLAGAKKKFRKK